MQLLPKTFTATLLRRGLALLLCLIFAIGFFSQPVTQVQAEGSRNLYPNGATGFRANINWRTGIFGQLLTRRTLLKVYARAGEVILVASSAAGIDQGDILIYRHSEVNGPVGSETLGTPDFSCVNDQRTPLPAADLGRIDSRAEELAGPDTIIDPLTGAEGNPADNTYAPCFYTAPADEIYYVAFLGPLGSNSDTFAPVVNYTGEIDLANPGNFNGNQLTSIAAWDVTVRDSLTSTTDITGRLFTDYLSMVTGANQRPVDSTLFVLTRDGYIYQTELSGIDPNAFVFFANSVGFLDNGVPLYRDIVSTRTGTEGDNLEGLPAGISMSPPDQFIFFDDPAPEAIAANGIGAPIVPQITSITFAGTLGGNDSLIGTGGIFTYASNTDGIYELVLSRDGVNFDPTEPTNRVLRGRGSAPTTDVRWNGLDNAGNAFPVGTDYPVRIILRAGEYHFPLLDAENSAGGPRYTLVNSPLPNQACPSFNGGGTSCSIAFYDDRGYTTSGGTNVGTPGTILPGNVPPNPDRSDPLGGFDTSSSNQRAFGNGTAQGFGDKKGLDIWTYFPSEIVRTTVDIFDTPPTPTPTPTTPPVPTPTPTTPPVPAPTATTPSSSDGGGGGGGGGDNGNNNNNDNNSNPNPTPNPTPVAVAAVVPATPVAPTLPVAFLPETGLRETSWEGWTISGGLILLVLGGFALRLRRKK